MILEKKNDGFTIVELLIVIIVIAILAAIVTVAYNGVQARAKDTERQTDIRSISQQLEIYYQLNGSYPPYSIAGNIGVAVTAWRSTNMPDLRDGALIPPTQSAVNLVNSTTPTTSQYGYHNNGSCVVSQCTQYRLYWKSDVDGSTKTIVGLTG